MVIIFTLFIMGTLVFTTYIDYDQDITYINFDFDLITYMDNIPYSYFINNSLVDILDFKVGNFNIDFIMDEIIINIFFVFNLFFNRLNLVYDGKFLLLMSFYSRIYSN